MKTLFIGYVVSQEMAENMPTVSNAGNNFQLGFLEAFSKVNDLEIATILPKATWPDEEQLFVPEERITLFDKDSTRTLRYINIKVIKELTILCSVRREIQRFCKKNKGCEIQIITYNGNGPVSIPVLEQRKKYGYRYTCLVVDPPLYQGTMKRNGFLWKFLYSSLAASYMRAAQKCDNCIVLNKFFAENNLKRSDYYVMDCGVSEKYISLCREEEIGAVYWKKDENIHLVFTGILHEHSGILHFISLFQELKPNDMKLHIFGKGIYEEQIKEISKRNASICFHGFLSNKDVLKVQSQADFLICPNTIDHPINKVAFPSKIQEYMLSGVPVIATAVNGLGKEYHPYLYLYDDTVQGLEAVFEKIKKDGYEKSRGKAEKAISFIMEEKTWDVQVRRLWSYLLKRIKCNES